MFGVFEQYVARVRTTCSINVFKKTNDPLRVTPNNGNYEHPKIQNYEKLSKLYVYDFLEKLKNEITLFEILHRNEKKNNDMFEKRCLCMGLVCFFVCLRFF